MGNDKRALMDKMWSVRKNLFIQIFRAIILGFQFWKLIRKVH